jgi:hypothetical protein
MPRNPAQAPALTMARAALPAAQPLGQARACGARLSRIGRASSGTPATGQPGLGCPICCAVGYLPAPPTRQGGYVGDRPECRHVTPQKKPRRPSGKASRLSAQRRRHRQTLGEALPLDVGAAAEQREPDDRALPLLLRPHERPLAGRQRLGVVVLPFRRRSAARFLRNDATA